MKSSPPNPIAERITRRWRIPSERTATRVAIGAALAGALITLAWTLGPVTFLSLPAILVSVIALLAPLWCAPIGLSMAVRLTAHHYSPEESALLRITTLPAGAIFEGYVEVTRTNLRLIMAFGRWAVIAALPPVAAGIGSAINPDLCRFSSAPCLPLGLLPGAAVLAVEALYAYFLTRALIAVGVWIGLRWGSWAQLISGVIVMAVVMICVLETLLLVLPPEALIENQSLVALGAPTVALVAALGLARFARADALRAIASASVTVKADL